MSDYDEESDYDVEDDSEDDDDFLDDESMDEDKLAAKDLQKLENKIAFGKQPKTKQPAKKRETKAKEKDLPKQEKPAANKRQKKEPKEAKPKEEKKTQKQIKEELKEEEKQKQILEDQIYFFKDISFEDKQNAGKEIAEFAQTSITKNIIDEIAFVKLVTKYNMHHPRENLQFLQHSIQQVFEQKKAQPQLCFQLFSLINAHFYSPNPCIQETMFFPNRENEKRLATLLRKAKKTLDICVFAFTNDRFRDAILYVWERGTKVRVITDDECSKFMGADIYGLGAKGIPCTMDNDWKVHMHNKFAIIDDLVLVTGSFNWTSQAVNQNQENLIVIENHKLVHAYKEEFEKLWVQFEKNRLSVADCKKKLEEEEVLKVARIQKMNDARKLKKEAKAT